jgi:hypothetical protein
MEFLCLSGDGFGSDRLGVVDELDRTRLDVHILSGFFCFVLRRDG